VGGGKNHLADVWFQDCFDSFDSSCLYVMYGNDVPVVVCVSLLSLVVDSLRPPDIKKRLRD
jgi:hypothetical protein